MLGIAIFVIALLLAVEALAATAPWLITLTVLSGIELFRPRGAGRVLGSRRLRGWIEGL